MSVEESEPNLGWALKSEGSSRAQGWASQKQEEVDVLFL